MPRRIRITVAALRLHFQITQRRMKTGMRDDVLRRKRFEPHSRILLHSPV